MSFHCSDSCWCCCLLFIDALTAVVVAVVIAVTVAVTFAVTVASAVAVAVIGVVAVTKHLQALEAELVETKKKSHLLFN